MIIGPTAVGKSAVAMHLGRCFDGEIVNADSLQLCKGLEIGTAKPSRRDRRELPHHLYEVTEPGEQLNAAEYAQLADAAIAEIHQRRRLPMVVGGSGFYLRALLHGLVGIPPIDHEIINKINMLEIEKGLTFLWERLKKVDAQAAERIHPHHSSRIKRALIVYEGTGKKISDYHRHHAHHEHGPAAEGAMVVGRYEVLKLGLTLPRHELYRRIDQRVEVMFASGILDEVKSFAAGTERGIGYAEAAEVNLGRLSLQAAIVKAAQRTRHYAKRQLTWFSREPDVHWFDMQEVDFNQSVNNPLNKIEQLVVDFLAHDFDEMRLS
jgi:tRNA dimethylallyltransferase